MNILENLRDMGVDTSNYFEASRFANQYTNRQGVGQDWYEKQIEQVFGIKANTRFTKEAEVLFRYMIAESVRMNINKQEITSESIHAVGRQCTNDFFKRFNWYTPEGRSKTGAEFEVDESGRVVFFKNVTADQIQLTKSTDGKRTNPRGAKQEGARKIFEANREKSNQEIVKLFMEQLDMSKAGATTYLYNLKKTVDQAA